MMDALLALSKGPSPELQRAILRDFFAGCALIGTASVRESVEFVDMTDDQRLGLAAGCYLMADAMLKIRGISK